MHAVVCPCGHGAITTERTEYDNRWSRDAINNRIECRTCASKYEFDYYRAPDAPGYALMLIAEAEALGKCWKRRKDLQELIQRDYCLPVIERLIGLARANERRGGKRKAWHTELSRWADALKLPPADGTWMLESFVNAHINLTNVAGIASDLGLAPGLDGHFAQLAELDEALRSRPTPMIWNGPPGQ